jgi:hypothetical protein
VNQRCYGFPYASTGLLLVVSHMGTLYIHKPNNTTVETITGAIEGAIQHHMCHKPRKQIYMISFCWQATVHGGKVQRLHWECKASNNPQVSSNTHTINAFEEEDEEHRPLHGTSSEKTRSRQTTPI